MSTPHHRKHLRLDHATYRDPGLACSITIGTANRASPFLDPRIAHAVIAALKERAVATGVAVHAYCLMPDHCHLLLSPAEGCDLVAFIGGFKSLSRRLAIAAGLTGPLWQRSFYDYFLRQEEHIETVARYILANPVKAGIVNDWRDYPLSGSLTLDVSDL